MAGKGTTLSPAFLVIDGLLDVFGKLQLVRLFAGVVKERPELHKDVDKVIEDVEKILEVLQEAALGP